MAAPKPRIIRKVDPTSGQLSAYMRTYEPDGTFDASKDEYLSPVYDTEKGEKGDSVKDLAINAGQLPPNATDDDAIAFYKGKPGKDSTVPGPSNYDLAKAAGFVGDVNAWLATQRGPKGDPGAPAKPGLLATAAALLTAGISLIKGVVYFFYPPTSKWLPLRPTSHERGQGTVAMLDSDGDLIRKGNPVKLTGLGFTTGAFYYVEAPDAVTGQNLQVVPAVAPATLAPTLSRSYFRAGQVYLGPDGLQYLDFDFLIGVVPNATATTTFFTNFTNLTYGQTLGGTLIRRLFDVPNNGGAALTGLRADGDADTDSGFPASPVKMTINGVRKGVFYQSMGYDSGSGHAFNPANWPAGVGFDMASVFAVADGDNIAPGSVFGVAGNAFETARLYGTCNYIAFQNGTYTSSAVSYPSNYRAGLNIAGSNKTLICQRVNVSADGKTMQVWVWPYDATKSMARQPENLPSAPTATYTGASAFPSGLQGLIGQNGKVRAYMMSLSTNPAVPAPFDGDVI